MTPRDPIPAPLRRFAELFDRGDYWEAHEALEGPWRARRSGFYKGLILYASALVHAKRGNARGVAAQLGKALAELERYPPRYLGVDVERIRDEARRFRELAAREAARCASLSPSPLGLRAEHVRGDEPERDLEPEG